MSTQNPVLSRAPSEFYSGDDLKAAEAIRNQDYSLLEEVLHRSPKVIASRGKKGVPLLAWAMGHNDPKAFKILLELGASPNDFFLVENVKTSLLSAATGAEKPDFFDQLLVHRADPNGLSDSEPPLFTAIFGHKNDRFAKLLRAGANINHPDRTGKTAIMVFVGLNNYREALNLARKGADVNVQMKNGNTIKKMIDRYPLPFDTPQGQAQVKLKKLTN
jgi:ankyrin repeat protein